LMRKVGVRSRIALATYAMSQLLVSSGQIEQHQNADSLNS